MTFEITSKESARKKRIKNEKKWKGFRIFSVISAVVTIYFFIIVVCNPNNLKPIDMTSNVMLFAFFLIASISSVVLIKNLTSAWIQERLNEHMWLEGNILHHFWQYSFAAGYNSWSTDLSGIEFQLDLSTIKNLKYDAKSGRIEFNISGQFLLYDDFRIKHVERVQKLDNSEYTHVCYDYYNPHLIEVFKSKGIPCTETTLDFKIRQV